MRKVKIKKAKMRKAVRHRRLTGDAAVLAILESGDPYALYRLERALMTKPGVPRVTVMLAVEED